MSTTIDQRVVEMRFDNSHFEKNTRETMSTLDKLKQKLNLSGAAKGLENINTSANKVNMNGLSNALTTVQTKFSALEVIGVTALANITNSAVNAGKRLIKSLTIDNISSGWNKYAEKTASVQTLVNSTGKSVEEINEYLDKLMWYSDETSYGFTDMTKALATMTSAGGDINKLIPMIEGVANATAYAGKGAAEFSHIMEYSINQAYSAGYMGLQDWKTISGSTVDTPQLKQALIAAAEEIGTIEKGAVTTANFISTLSDKWLTTEVMEAGFEQFSKVTEAIYEGIEDGTFENYADGLEKIGDQFGEAAYRAAASAQEAKTFQEAIEATKDALSSTFLDMFEIIFGDYEKATALWTDLCNSLYDVFVAPVQTLRDVLKQAFEYNPFTVLLDKINNSAIGQTIDTIQNATETLEYYQDVVTRVWRGDYNNRGDNPDRFDLLRAEGYNPSVVQNLVNLGYQHKLTIEEVTAAEKKYGITTTNAQTSATTSTETTTEATADLIVELVELSDAELKAKGYTEEQIDALRALAKAAEKTGIPLKEFIENIDEIDGRYLFINSFKNIGKVLMDTGAAIKQAWNDIFYPGLDEEGIIEKRANSLYNVVAAVHKLTSKLPKLYDEEGKLTKTGDKLVRTFKGLFAILQLISNVIGGGFKIAFTILKTVLGMFNISILDFTAIIGDAAVALRDFVKEHDLIAKGIKLAITYIFKIAKAIAEYVKELWQLPGVQKYVTKLTDAFKKLGNIKLDNIISALKTLGKKIKEVFSNINERFNGVPGDIISGLGSGLKNGISKVITFVVELATTIINKFCEILGIHSPSKVFFAIGGFIIAGLVAGLLSGNTNLSTAASTVVDKIKDFFTNTDWSNIFSKIFSTGMSVGLLLVAKNLSDTIKNFSSLASGLGSMFDGIGNVTSAFAENMKKITKSLSYTIKSFGKVLKGIAFKKTAEGVKELAWSILIIAGAVYLLAQLDYGKLWSAVGAIAVLSGVLVALTWGLNKINESAVSFSKDGKKINANFKTVKASLLSIGAALLMMGLVVKMMGNMSPDQMKQGFIGLAGAVVALGVLLAAYGLLIKGKGAQNMDKAGKMIKKMAWALLLMVVVVKLVSLLDWSEMGKGAVFIAGFLVFVLALVAITKLGGKRIDEVGKMVSKISWALLLMVIAVKLISLLDWTDMGKGAAFAAAFLVFVGILVGITKIGKEEQIAKIGSMVLAISAAMLIMAVAIKIIGDMEWGSLAKGAIGIIIFGVIIAALLKVVDSFGAEAPKLAATLLAMAVAIGILAAVAIVLSLISIEGLAKGIVAVGLLGGIVALMLKATENAKEAKGTLIAMAIAIGVMAAAIAVLSFIDPTRLLSATVAIGVLMGMFALIEKSSKDVTGAWTAIVAMTAVIVALGVILIILSKSPIENALAASISLSVLLLSMAVVLKILSTIGPLASAAYPAMGALAVFIIGLVALLGVIGALVTWIPNAKEFISTGLSIMIQIAEGLGEMIGAFVKGALTQISNALPVIGDNLSKFMNNIGDFITGAGSINKSVLAGISILSAAIIELTAAELISAIGSFLSGRFSIAVFGLELSGFMNNAKDFLTGLENITPETANAAKSLAALITAISGLKIGNIIGLDTFGEKLALFGSSLEDFAVSIANISNEDLNRIDMAAQAGTKLSEMAETLPRTGGYAQKLLGEKDMNNFSTSIVAFGEALVAFGGSLSAADSSIFSKIEVATEAGQKLADLEDSLPRKDGWWQDVAGEKDLTTFGASIVAFGKALVNYGIIVRDITDGDANKIILSAEAGQKLADLEDSLPRKDGWWQDVAGEKDIGTFGSAIKTFAQGLVEYIAVAKTIDDAAITAITNSGNAIDALKEVAEKVPKSGGWWSAIAGEKDSMGFGESIRSLAIGILSYINVSKSITEDSIKQIKNSKTAIEAIDDITDSVPEDNSSAISAKNFMSAMNDVIYSINDFIVSSYSVTDDGIASINKAGTASDAIISVAGKLKDIDSDSITNATTSIDSISSTITKLTLTNFTGIDKFIEGLSKIANADFKGFVNNINSFVTNMTGVVGDNMSSAINKVKDLLEMVSSVSGSNIRSLEAFGSSLKTFAEDVVKGFVEAFSGESPKSKAEKAVEEMVQAGIDGADDKKTDVENAFKAIAQAAADALSSQEIKDSAKSAGKALVEGFASGINDNTYLATAKAKAMANAAEQAARDALDINSPSRVFRKIGSGVPEGFAQGITMFGSSIKDSVATMSSTAISGTRKAISRIVDAINTDMDSQPTIRPVLDLSEVESGASYLSSMFSNGPSVGVNANLNAISSSMNSRIQNGVNDDVVSAIYDLGKTLSGTSGDTYNINGVSVDDDSNVTNAVKTIIRAATVGRRV